MPKLIDLLGKRVGRLTVVKRAHNKGKVKSWMEHQVHTNSPFVS